MRTSIFATAILAIMTFVSPSHADTWQVEAVHTSVVFKVKHMDISNFYGRFNEISGSLDTGDNASFDFTVPVASIDTNNTKRDDHLRSPDFFNVKQFPTISFKGNSVTPNDNGMELKGELMLHGVTKPLSVLMTKIGEGEDQRGSHRIGLETTFTIKRSDFGMDQMIGPVGDEVTLTISIEAIRQ